MEIFTFGVGERLEACREYLSGISSGGERLILLPIPTTKDRIHINGTELPITEIYKLIKDKTVVAGYGVPEEIREHAERLGALVIDAEGSEEFLLENARLTAEGALGVLLTTSKRSVRDDKIGIIGYGRIGSRLMEMLMFLGAKIRLYTRSDTLRASLGKEGVDTSDFNSESDYSGLDILVNTAPVTVFSEEMMRKYEERGLRILDLASGKCFPESEQVKKLSSIPVLFYPVTAGKLYGELIEEKMKGFLL